MSTIDRDVSTESGLIKNATMEALGFEKYMVHSWVMPIKDSQVLMISNRGDVGVEDDHAGDTGVYIDLLGSRILESEAHLLEILKALRLEKK